VREAGTAGNCGHLAFGLRQPSVAALSKLSCPGSKLVMRFLAVIAQAHQPHCHAGSYMLRAALQLPCLGLPCMPCIHPLALYLAALAMQTTGTCMWTHTTKPTKLLPRAINPPCFTARECGCAPLPHLPATGCVRHREWHSCHQGPVAGNARCSSMAFVGSSTGLSAAKQQARQWEALCSSKCHEMRAGRQGRWQVPARLPAC